MQFFILISVKIYCFEFRISETCSENLKYSLRFPVFS